MNNDKKITTALGFDFGMKRIGVALGQTITNSAKALPIIKAQDGIPPWEQIEHIIKRWDINVLVVGLPLNLDGSEQEISLAARKFSRRLQNKFNCKVHLVDERYTTKAAKTHPHMKIKKDEPIDSYAAVIILESWLEQQTKEP